MFSFFRARICACARPPDRSPFFGWFHITERL